MLKDCFAFRRAVFHKKPAHALGVALLHQVLRRPEERDSSAFDWLRLGQEVGHHVGGVGGSGEVVAPWGEGLDHEPLHLVLAELSNQPIADGGGLQFIDGIVQVEFAGLPEQGAGLAARYEDLRVRSVRRLGLASVQVWQ